MPAGTATSNPYADQGDDTDGFIVRVYNKALEYQGFLGGYESLTCVARHNAISTAELVVRADHPRAAELLLPGCRLAISYNHGFLMSGRMESRGMSANAGTPTITCNMVDDFQYFNLILGWPDPEHDITDQKRGIDGDGTGDEPTWNKAYWRSAGIASNVVKYIMSRNKNRLGLNLAVYGVSDDLGGEIHIRSRMDTLADVLIAKVDRAGLGMRIGGFGTDGNLSLRFYEPTVRDRVLTADSGALVDWSWTQAEPTVTRVVIGGAGEHTEREYQAFVDDERESIIGTIKEAFVDARDIGADYEEALKDVPVKLTAKNLATKDRIGAEMAVTNMESTRDHAFLMMQMYAPTSTTPDAGKYTDWSGTHDDDIATLADLNATLEDRQTEEEDAIAAYDAALALRDELKTSTDTEMAEKAQDVFAETQTQYGLSLTLAETPTFRYGDTFVVGDTVTIALPGSVTITDTVREVTISDTVEAGLVVSPVVGTQDTMDNPNRVLVGAIKRLMFAARKNNTSR